MDQGILTRTEDYLRSNRKKVRWRRVVSLMSGIVMFCTTYIFILPAITMTPELICGQAEHIHTTECYETAQSPPEAAPILVCTLEEREDSEHIHDAACYETMETLVCPLVEDEEHTHEESCYETEEILTCPLEEAFTEGHTHGEGCYFSADAELSPEEQDTEPALMCGLEEHTHSTDCYNFPLEETGPAYYCGFHSEHTHDEGCRFESGELQCTLPEHTHSEDCAVEPPEALEPMTPTFEEGSGPVYYCGFHSEHTHDEGCWLESGELQCTLPEHTHSENCTVEPPEALEPDAPEPVTLGFEEETELFRTAWQVTLPEGVAGSSDAYSFTTELVDEEDDLTYAYTGALTPQEGSVTLPIGVLRFRLTDGDGNEVDPGQYTVSGVLVPSRALVAYAAMQAENSPLTLELDGGAPAMESGSSTLRLYRLDEGELETAAAVSVQLPGNQELDMDAGDPYDEAYAMELSDFGGNSLMLAADWGNWGGNSGTSTLMENFNGFTSGVEYYLKHTCHHSNTASGDEYGYQVYLDVNPKINLNDKKTHIIVGPAVGDEITSGRPGENSTHTKWLYERNADGTWHISTIINGKRYYLALGEVDFGSFGVFVQDTPFAFTIGSGNYMNYGGSNEDHPGFIYSGEATGSRGGSKQTLDLYLDHNGNNKSTYIFKARTPTDGANEQLFDAERDVIPVIPPEPEPTTYTLAVNKVDGHTSNALSGAQFALYSDANCNEKIADLTAGADGSSFTLAELELDKDYWLKEAEAPAGYTPLANPIQFQVDAEGNVTFANDTNSKNQQILLAPSYDSNAAVLTLTVANYTGIELPATGGTGLAHWYAIGAMLLFGAAGLMYMNNKQHPGKNFEKEQ